MNQLKMTKQKLQTEQRENKASKVSLKTTAINEIKIENELYKQELYRLRTLIETELNIKQADIAAKIDNSSLSQTPTQLRAAQAPPVAQPDPRLVTLRKTSTEQAKKILIL